MHACIHTLEYSALNPHLHVHHLCLYPHDHRPLSRIFSPYHNPSQPSQIRILNYQVKDMYFSDLSPKTRSQTPFFQLPLLYIALKGASTRVLPSCFLRKAWIDCLVLGVSGRLCYSFGRHFFFGTLPPLSYMLSSMGKMRISKKMRFYRP